MRLRLCVILLLVCCSWVVCRGQTASSEVVLQDTTRFLPLGRRVTILEDKTARLTFDQVRKRTDFVPSYSNDFQYGYTSSAYWFRFDLLNRSRENEKHWLLGLLDAISLDYVDLYLVYPNGQVVHQLGGLKRPYVDQGFFATAPFFRVTLPANQPVTAYFRLESSLSIYGKVTVWEEYYNLSRGRVIIYVLWMFLGLFILRSLNSFVLARFIPDPQFRFYAVCTFLLYMSTLARSGVYPLVLSGYPGLLDWMQYGMIRLLPFGLAAWMYSLLDNRPAFRPLRWLLFVVMVCSLVGVVLPLVVQNAAIGAFFAVLVLVTYILFFIGVVLVSTMGTRPALYLVLPITLCTIPFALYQLQTLQIVRYSTLISQLPLLALAIEMVSMSLVLGRIVQSYIKERIASANALMQEKVEVDKLQELSVLKTRFFTNISHELRTPLTLIISPLSELKKRFPDEPLLSIMERNSNRLLTLINQLLDLSKLEAGKLTPEYEPGDLATFLRTLVSSFESLAQSRQIRFTYAPGADEYWAGFDRDKTEKIVTNLLSNAFKFTPAGHDVRLEAQFGPNDLQLLVADTGIGIAPANLPHIFERFYQVESHTHRTYEGTGVGLSLVHELVDVLGGTIGVRSIESTGTTFTVRLPLEAVSAPTATTQAASLPDPADLTATLWDGQSPARTDFPQPENEPEAIMLIIDDNADIRAYLKSLFSDKFQVMEAADGAEGLEKASVTLPDIVICDLMMPRFDGFAFCRTLKDQETTSHIPILMLTAKAGLQDRVEGFDLGADAYLTKPFDRIELLALVRNLMRRQAQLRQYFGRTPAEPPTEPVDSREDAFLQKVRAMLDTQLARTDFTIDLFSQQMGMSQSQLVRKLKALTGQTAVEFLRNYRLERAAGMLKQGDLSVSEVAYEVGFESLSYFARVFQEKYGVSPSAYGSQPSLNNK